MATAVNNGYKAAPSFLCEEGTAPQRTSEEAADLVCSVCPYCTCARQGLMRRCPESYHTAKGSLELRWKI